MQNVFGDGVNGLDLASLLSGLLKGNGMGGLRSLMIAQMENSLVMRRHMLRAEAEVLQGLLAVIDEELKKIDREIEEGVEEAAPVGREKVSID